MKFNKAKFKELREKSGISMANFAKACKVSKATVWAWGGGLHEYGAIPNPDQIRKICKILNCKAEDLADYSAETATITGITGSLKRIESMVREMPRESSQEEASELMTTAAALMITICKFYEGIKP